MSIARGSRLHSHLLAQASSSSLYFFRHDRLPDTRTFAASASKDPEVLHNSMSDGFYDVKNREVAQQERVAQDRPRNVRQALNSLSEPMPGFLQNSMSDGLYEYHPRRRIVPSRVAHSMSDPLPGWLQNSMSDAHYEMPQSLRTTALNPKPRQGFSTARSSQTTHRIVVVSRASVSDPEPLHNSFAHGDYTPRKQ